MEFLDRVLVLVHLVGFAALLGGVLVQWRTAEPEVDLTMLAGAWTELVSGAGLVVLALVLGHDLDQAQTAVKLALTVFVVLLVVRNRRYASIPRGLCLLIGLLTLAGAAVSVLWP